MLPKQDTSFVPSAKLPDWRPQADRATLRIMSKLTIELSDELAARLEAVSAVQNVPPAQWATEAVARALPPHLPAGSIAQGWPVGYFEKYPGCLAGDNWQPPADPPPERTPAW